MIYIINKNKIHLYCVLSMGVFYYSAVKLQYKPLRVTVYR